MSVSIGRRCLAVKGGLAGRSTWSSSWRRAWGPLRTRRPRDCVAGGRRQARAQGTAGRQRYAAFATLGGRPEDPACYDVDGHVRYDRLATTAAFLAGIERTRPAGQQALFAVETAIVTVVEEQGCKPAWFKVLGSNGAPEPPARRSAEQQQLRQRDLE